VTALEVHSLSKSYPLSNSQWARFRHAFAQERSGTGLWALRDVSFSVNKGEAFGVVGANGSGKSTLLQIIAGILQPTSGTVEVRGRLSALLELGSGFAPEFSGRQNVYLNASILGLSTEEIDARFETIERFASIGDFIDQPIRTYSTGMVLRLAFAVVAHVEPEILIVDEALAVGDIAFRQRCMRRIHDLRAGGTTILFVSHETGDVKALCERCLWLENGTMRGLGEADDVIGDYLSAMMQRERVRDAEERATTKQTAPEVVRTLSGTHRYGDETAEVSGAELTTAAGVHLKHWIAGASAVLRLSFRVVAPLRAPIAGFLVRNEKGETIFGSNTTRENYPLPEMQAGEVHTVDFHWVLPELAPGRYFVSVAVSEGTLDDFHVCDYVEDGIEIEVPSTAREVRGYLRLRCSSVEIHRG
jgi:ABC-type polysaccharide/polyol phosphate transport system ATPase subunit